MCIRDSTYPDISLIVIDTLQKVRKGDRNGSMYANDYKDIGALKELADKYGICILLVHHPVSYTHLDVYKRQAYRMTTLQKALKVYWICTL